MLNEIHNEDCIQGMMKIPDRSVDLILCDLPYGGAIKRGGVQWDEKIDLNALWKEYKRVIKPGGNILFFASGTFVANVVASNPKWYRYNLVWVKNRISDFFHASQKPMSKHEDSLVFGAKGKHTYNSGVVSSRGAEYTNRGGKCYAGSIRRSGERKPKRNYPTTILEYATIQKQRVASEKPLELVRKLVRMYSNEGDVVLDPCIGSGTTIVACRLEGRNYIGFEKNEENYKIASVRIAEFASEAENKNLFEI